MSEIKVSEIDDKEMIKVGQIDDKEMIKIEEREKLLNKEREKMLNEENAKDIKFDAIDEDVKDKVEEIHIESIEVIKTGEVEKMKKQIEESQKEVSIRVPFGGIKIPGFLRSKSRDKTKEGDIPPEEPDVEPPCVAQNVRKEEPKEPKEPKSQAQIARERLRKIMNRVPYRLKTVDSQEKTDNLDETKETKDGNVNTNKQNLIDSIKIPLISVLPKKIMKDNKEQKKDTEMAAGLASMETLEDSKESNGLTEDGMETVKLDVDDSKDEESQELASKRRQNLFNELSFRDWRYWPEKIRRMSKHQKAILAAIILCLILIILLIILLSSSKPPTSPPIKDGRYIVTTSSCGPVEGLLEDGIFKFHGIPYAVPPVGQKRWQYAEPLDQLDKCWNGTLKAHNATSTCWQLYMERNGKWRIDGAEDCLTLDILTPHVRYDSPLPVVVLIDAATLVGGSPGILKPTPKIIKSKEVVFVRPNFRLGVFGFLAVDTLSKSIHPPRSGNYGLSDILTALKWIKMNIMHFGGNENMITIVGHRAGATLVTALAGKHSSLNLFNRAWASSGSVVFPNTVLQLAEQANQRYVDHICLNKTDKLYCLRTHDAEELVEEIEDSWRPTVTDLPSNKEANASKHEWLVLDGNILRENLWELETPRLPFVMGTTAHGEASPQLWEKLQKIPGSKDEAITTHIKDSYIGTLGAATEALNLYNSTWEGLAAMVSEIRTICPLLNFTTQHNIDFYVATLERNHTDFGQIADIDADMSSILGNYEPRTTAQQNFVSTIQNLFYKFVSMSEWEPKKKPVLMIGQTADWQDDYRNCKFWAEKGLVPKFARRD